MDGICIQYPDQYVCLVDIEHAELWEPRDQDGASRGLWADASCCLPGQRSAQRENPLHAVRFTGVCTQPLIRPSLVLDDETLELLRS